MKYQNQIFKIFTLLVLFASSICSTTLFAQNDASKTMTITVIAVDEEGNQTTQTIVKQDAEINEDNLQSEIDALIEEMSPANAQLEIDVNVEIEDNNEVGSNVDEEETTISIDVSGDNQTKMMIINSDTDELDEETRKKIEEALEGTDIDLDELLGGKTQSQQPQRIQRKEVEASANRAFLGVVYRRVHDQEGVGITNIIEGSAAEIAGLQKGDQFVSIDGKAVYGHSGLVHTISKYNPGDVITIIYSRNGEQLTTTATLTGNEKRNGNVKRYNKIADCYPGCCPEWTPGCCEEKQASAGCCDDEHEKAFLGVYLNEAKDFKGAKVAKVIRGTNAATLNMQVGDVITKVGKSKIKNADELIEAIQQYKVGDKVKIHWTSGSNKIKKKVVFAKQKRRSGSCCCGNASQNKITEKKIIIRKKKLESSETVIEENNTARSFLNLNTLEIFPNPTDGIITVKFSIDNQESTKIEMIDVTGKAIFSEINPDFDGSYSRSIDLTGNPEGVYILSISQNDKVFTEKVIFNKQ